MHKYVYIYNGLIISVLWNVKKEKNMEFINWVERKYNACSKKSMNQAYNAYKKYYLRSIILESLASSTFQPKSIKDIGSYITEERRYDYVELEIIRECLYLMELGFLDRIDTTNYRITTRGEETLRNGIYENLSNSAFFGYNSMVISKLALWIGLFTLLIAIGTLIISFFLRCKV